MSLVAMGTFAATVLVTLSPDLSGNFVATGAADQVEINAGIVYCAAIGGGEVVLGPGGWTLAATVNVPAGVLLRGMGWTTILNYDAGGNCITFTGDNAKLRDLKIVIVAGAGAGGTRPNGVFADTRTNLEVSGVWVIGDNTVAYDTSVLRQGGVVFVAVTESKVTNNQIESTRYSAVTLSASEDNRVNNNTCQGNTVLAIQLLAASSHNTVTGNVCPDNGEGIYVENSNDNTLTGNTCQGNAEGIALFDSDGNTITGNTCQGNAEGIWLSGANNNTVTGNTCTDSAFDGIWLDRVSDNNTLTGNTGQGNTWHGIMIETSPNNTLTGNTCQGNTRSGINITDTSADNTIHSNTCNDNDLYGIDIDDANALRNWVKNNQLRGNTAGAFNDAGTGTKLATIPMPFIQGSTFISADGSAKGWEINAEADMAVALGQLPLEVQQVVRVKIWAVALGAPAGAGGQMHLDVVIQAGADNLAYTTENIALADFDSVTTDYVNTDVVHWSIDSGDDADIADLVGGMSFECKINGAVAAAPDGATNATFRVCMVEVV